MLQRGSALSPAPLQQPRGSHGTQTTRVARRRVAYPTALAPPAKGKAVACGECHCGGGRLGQSCLRCKEVSAEHSAKAPVC